MSAAPPIRSRLTVRVLDAAGAELGGFTARVRWSKAPLAGAWDVELRLTAEADRECAVRVGVELEETPTAFLVPGCLYPDAVPSSPARQPRWAAEPSEDPLAASSWSFGSDRASHPAVLAWGGTSFTALATSEADGPLGMTGLGFQGEAGGGRIWLDFPAREEPVAFDGRGPAPAWAAVHRWRRGETQTLRLTVQRAAPEPHAYDPLLRLLYERSAAAHPLAPWMEPEAAARLAAEGLLRHHFHRKRRVIAETRGFAPGPEDREDMHSAWLSGAPVAAALLAHGRTTGDALAAAAGEAVLDHLEAGLAPCGLPWGRWTPDRGWVAGWTPPGTIHSRTAAEAVLFLARAGRRVDRALDAAERSQRADGALPALFDAGGEGIEWCGTAGLAWVAPLAEAGRLGAAERAGGFYAPAVEECRLAGAPEDVPLAPTSEDGYVALMAYAALHRATGEPRWLELARRAAGWTMTFRWAHNLRWPEHTLLHAYDFRTRGADAASAANPHLHAYGLVCLPELEHVARAADDAHLQQRADDNLACFLQMLARTDGDFNARRGMATERYYNTRAFGPKGGILPVSHAWCLGLLLWACTHRARTAVPAALPEASRSA